MKPIILIATIVLVVVFFTACTKVTPNDQAHAVKLCADNRGVTGTEVESVPGGRRKVSADCADGTFYTRIGK